MWHCGISLSDASCLLVLVLGDQFGFQANPRGRLSFFIEISLNAAAIFAATAVDASATNTDNSACFEHIQY